MSQSGDHLSRQQIRKLKLYTPHSKQKEFHDSKSRFRVVSFGRQSGKSTACNNELLKKAWEKPMSVLWYISPTYDSATIMFRRAVSALQKSPDIFSYNKAELSITFINGSRIFYKSGQVLENLRSETLHGVVIDEVRNQHQDLWPMVIRPMLATTKGWAAFISTPNGFDHFYDMFTFAETDETKEWSAFKAPSTANPLITEDELNDARRTMSESQFAQEYLAEFRDLTAGKAYINFSADNQRLDNPFWADGLVHPRLPILLGMDFNLSPMAWTLGQKKIDDYYWFDEIWIKGTHTQEAAKVLVEKLIKHHPNIYKMGIILCGDATSKAGQRAAAGQSDYDIVCQELDRAKIPWQNLTPESNPPVKDRVNNVNAKLKDANGNIHCWLHPINCQALKKDFERVVWRNTAGETIALDQTTYPDLTHSSDSVGYPMTALSPLVYNATLPTMRIIMRG